MRSASHGSSVSPTAPTHAADDTPGNTPATSPPLLTELEGTIVGARYELGRVLGTGGMGAVFEAEDWVLDRRVAIKVIKPGLSERSVYIQRFLREAKAASKIRHHNVVVNLDYGEADGLVYSVMELLEGEDLKQLLDGSPQGRLPWAQARELLIQIASGLKAAHDQGVIHRDIKPANCFVTQEDGQPVVKLVDFGIAKFDDPTHDEQLTQTSQWLGTPCYMAPELMRKKKSTSPRSDTYSLGVVAYQLLTGSLPFVGETMFEVMYRACLEQVPKLRRQVPELPKGAEELVREMLAKEPAQRPSDMEEVRQRLLALPGRSTTRRPWGKVGVGGLAVVMGLGVIAWSTAGTTTTPPAELDAHAPPRAARATATVADRGSRDDTTTPTIDRGSVTEREATDPPAASTKAEGSSDAPTLTAEATPSDVPEATPDSLDPEPTPEARRSPPLATHRAPRRSAPDQTSVDSEARSASRACGRKHGSLMPTMTVEFEVREDGTVADPSVLPPMTMAPVGLCVAERIAALRFPAGEPGKKKWKLPL